MPANATLDDLLRSVQRPGRLLRVLLYNLEACQDANGSAYVRLGPTPYGFHPTHLVVFDLADGTEATFGRFDNATGDFQDGIARIREWSPHRTGLAEVERMLDTLLRPCQAGVRVVAVT